jgi:phospho-N-acetylmuramoyl-pentapeptide-transferase
MAVGGFLCVLCVRTSHTQGLFLSACTVGICIAFLLFNAHPARIFMGDTGSLFLGASVAGIALYTGQILPVCIGGIFYLIEAASVILQVGYFKLTGRRLFKMAPFHHHLEQCGYTEGKIVFLAVGLTLAFCVLAFFGVQ